MNHVASKQVIRAKYLARNIVEKSNGSPVAFIGMEDVLPARGQLVSGYGDLEVKSASDSLLAHHDDVLFGKLRPYLSKSLVLSESTSCTGEFLVLRSANGTLPRYLYYLTLSQPWLSWAEATSYGSKMPRTSWDLMSTLNVPRLSPEEQSAIANFLDRETAKIDALIGKQEQLITTLREDRIATITHAVTKGLDPNVEMKDSGVEWLGEIPAHWQIAKFGWHASCRSGEALKQSTLTVETDDQLCIPVIGGNGVMGFSNVSNIKNDVLVVGRVGALCGNVHLVESPAWITDNALILNQIDAEYEPRYLWYLLTARKLNSIASQTAQPLITGTQISSQRIPLQSLIEQRAIVSYLDAHCAKLDAVITKSEQMIATLREYRSALITDAVTGKIDVRGVA